MKLTPTTIVIDKRGNIVSRYWGPDFAKLNALIEQKLADPSRASAMGRKVRQITEGREVTEGTLGFPLFVYRAAREAGNRGSFLCS